MQRVKKVKRKKLREQERMQKDIPVFHEGQDDAFYSIAGYTSGGVSYGITQEELGLRPDIWETDN